MSTPPFDPEDPRLTAYALGEANPNDNAAVEQILADSPEARAEVEQTRAFAQLLAAGYAREQEQYLATQPSAGLPLNVIRFPDEKRGRWQRALSPLLKAAALLALTASLLYATWRRPTRPLAVVAASPATTVSPTASVPPLLASTASSVKDADGVVSDAPVAALAGTTAPPMPLLADRSSGATVVQAEVPQPAGALERIPQARAFSRSAAVAAPPLRFDDGAATAAAAAAPMALPRDDARLASSVVRVRSSAGVFFGGVILSQDGLVLAAASLPDLTSQEPCTVRLADERELPATVENRPIVAGLSMLRVGTVALPAVRLAKEAPGSGTTVSALSVNPQTGAVTFDLDKQGKTNPGSGAIDHLAGTRAEGPAGLAFNTAGELLIAQSSPVEIPTLSKAKSAIDPHQPPRITVRIFSADERSKLQRAKDSAGGN